MNFQDLRRIVEERSTGYYQHQETTDHYAKYHSDKEQHKIFKAMLRSEILERFKSLNDKVPSKIIVSTQHHIYEFSKENRDDTYCYYRSGLDKVLVPKGANRESFEINVEIRMSDGVRSWNCTRHALELTLTRHSKNMNWQTNLVKCNKQANGSYRDKTSEPMIYIARELEGLFGVEVSQVEKSYKSFGKIFKEGQDEIVHKTRKPSNDNVVVARRIRTNGNQRVERTTERQEVEDTEVELRYTEGTSNKFYRIKVREIEVPHGLDSLWEAVAFYGRIGQPAIDSIIETGLHSRNEALRYARDQQRKKINKGYIVHSGGIL